MKHFLRNRDAVLVVGARALMFAMDALVLTVLVLRVHAGGSGPLANAGLFIALAVPSALLAAPAGRVADRFDSRLVLTSALAVQAVAATALAAADDLVWTYAWAGILQSGFVFASPVWQALVPRIVGEEGVQALAGVQMLAGSIAGPVGAGLGGVLVEALGPRTPTLAASLLALTVAALAWAVRTRRGGVHSKADAAGPAASGPRGGLALVLADPVLRGVLIGGVILVIVAQGVSIVAVFLVRDELGASPAQYGLGEVVFGVGSLVAAAIVVRLNSDRRRILGIVIGFGATAALIAALGTVTVFEAYLVLMTLMGLGNATANGSIAPLFLLRTDEAHRGRVMAIVGGAFSVASVIALVLGGIAGSTLGPRLLCIIGGLLGVGATGVMAVLARSGLTLRQAQGAAAEPVEAHAG